MHFNIFIYSALLSVVPSEMYSNAYDMIIIPVRSNHKRLKPKIYTQRDATRQMDMHQYDQPTELPDIDNFDHTHAKYMRTHDRMMDFDEFEDGDDKIVGGSEVDINLYPYHVAYGSNCAGAIIDAQWIISAGHCGKKPYIKMGSKYYSKGKKIQVAETFIHPNWTSEKKEHAFDYDFQLVKMAEPINLSDNAQPVKVARMKDMVTGKVITVTGWGNMEEDGPYSQVLRAIRVPIIPKEKCQEVPFPYFKGTLTQRMFCAGFQEATMDACQGDSGGPAVSDGRLMGMVSFGYGCATPGSYGVYSKVAKVRPWIEEVTGLKLD